MKKTFCILLFAPFLTLLLFCATSAFAAKIELQGIRHVVSAPGQEEVHLQLSAENEPHIWVTKENSARVVLDFPNTIQTKNVPNTINAQGNIVRRIRVGIHDNKVRVVCDLPSLQGVERDVRYDASSRNLVVRFTGPQTDLRDKPDKAAEQISAQEQQTEQEEKKDVQAETSTPAGPISNKKHSAIALQPARPPVEAGEQSGDEATKLEKNASEEAVAQTDEESSTQQTDKPAGASSGSAAVIGGSSLFLPPPEALAPSTEVPDEESDITGSESGALEETVTDAPDSDETTDVQDENAPFLQSVSFQGDSPKGELVIFRLNGFYPPVVQGVEQNIPRIFCEFNDMTTSRELIRNPVKPDKSRHVNSIRLQQQHAPNKIQAIVELEPGKSYDLQQVFFKKENMFVLIINEAKR